MLTIRSALRHRGPPSTGAATNTNRESPRPTPTGPEEASEEAAGFSLRVSLAIPGALESTPACLVTDLIRCNECPLACEIGL